MSALDHLGHSLLLAVVLLSSVGCEEEEGDYGIELGDQSAPAPTADEQAKAAEEEEDDALPMVEFDEGDFVESGDSRDPFRDYSHRFVKRRDGERVVQRKIKAAQFALDELRLTGIISRGKRSIMLTDPNGFGWLLYTGDFVGKPELVSAGGMDGADVAINWRVDRIRVDDVIFIREDASHPDIPPTTRVMPLYPSADEDT